MRYFSAVVLGALLLSSCATRAIPQSPVLPGTAVTSQVNAQFKPVPVGQEGTLEILIYADLPPVNERGPLLRDPYAYLYTQVNNYLQASGLIADGDIAQARFQRKAFQEAGKETIALQCLLSGVKDVALIEKQAYPNLIAYLVSKYNQDGVREFSLSSHYLTDKTGTASSSTGKILVGSDF